MPYRESYFLFSKKNGILEDFRSFLIKRGRLSEILMLFRYGVLI